MMDLIIAVDWSGLKEALLGNEYFNAAIDYIGTLSIPVGIVLYYRVIAPRLAKAKFINSQFNEILKIVDKLDTKMDETIGVNLKLKEDLIIIREAFGLAFENSNLTGSVKTILKTVLNGYIKGEKVDVSEELEGMSDDVKEVVNKTIAATENVMEENKSSALAQLAAEVEAAKEVEDVEQVVNEESEEQVSQEG